MISLAMLQNPDAAVVALFAGILLVYFECNRPGTIVPGCLGAVLILLSVNALTHLALRPAGLGAIAAGFSLLLLELARPARNLSALLGTVAICAGLATLVQPFAAARVHPSTALFTGIGFSASTLWLGKVAVQARRNKRLTRPSAPQGDAVQDRLKESRSSR